MSKLSILLLNYEYPPLGGGAANATKYLLKEYENYTDLNITVVTSSTDKQYSKQINSHITIHFLDIGKDNNLHYQSQKDLVLYAWKTFFYVKKLQKTQKFDLIHAFFGIPCGFIAQKLGLPYIVSLRGSDVPNYNPRFKYLDMLIFRRLSKSIWKHSKKTIANSQGLADLTYKTAPRQKVLVIPNGIDITEFKPQHQIPKIPLNILGVGRLIPRKGFDLMIQAAKDLPLTITLVGEGPDRKKLELLAQKLNVKVNFLGLVDHDQLARIYQNHDLFVLPSANEGMSNTILEAMASGLPIITTNTGGTAELITDNGWIVQRNLISLKQALKDAINSPGELISKGHSSRIIAKKFSWKSVAQQYIDIYYQVLS